MDAAANNQCPREVKELFMIKKTNKFCSQCEDFEGNRACCGGCPRECREACQQKRTLEKCRKYGMDKAQYGNQCFCEVIIWLPHNRDVIIKLI